MAFSVYKSPLHEQSSRVIGKKKLHWRNISGFQQCNFYSDIMFCCRDILLVLKSQLFRQNWPKLGEILFYWHWILIWLQCKPQQGSWS